VTPSVSRYIPYCLLIYGSRPLMIFSSPVMYSGQPFLSIKIQRGCLTRLMGNLLAQLISKNVVLVKAANEMRKETIMKTPSDQGWDRAGRVEFGGMTWLARRWDAYFPDRHVESRAGLDHQTDSVRSSEAWDRRDRSYFGYLKGLDRPARSPGRVARRVWTITCNKSI